MYKKNRIIKLILLFISLLILFSCSSNKLSKTENEKMILLENELNNWSSFSITGNCSISAQGFNIKRPFVVSLGDGKFRFDILDNSILGLGSGLFAAIYVDKNTLQIKQPGSNITSLILEDYESIDVLEILTETIKNYLQKYKMTIIKDNSINIRGVNISFNENMKLNEIDISKEKIKINFYYDKKDQLFEIKATHPQIKNLLLDIDKIKYNDITITPLSK
jgi:hypothetical protein